MDGSFDFSSMSTFNFSPVHYISSLVKNERVEYVGETRFY